jgi:hypothetical protein
MTTTRPTVLQWLRYWLGGSLPPELSDWILHDTTGRTWVARHVARAVLHMAPIVLVALVFLPMPFPIRIATVVGGMVMGLIFATAYIIESTERRLEKAGFPAGLGERIRRERAEKAHAATAARLRSRSSTRAHRHIH